MCCMCSKNSFLNNSNVFFFRAVTPFSEYKLRLGIAIMIEDEINPKTEEEVEKVNFFLFSLFFFFFSQFFFSVPQKRRKIESWWSGVGGVGSLGNLGGERRNGQQTLGKYEVF